MHQFELDHVSFTPRRRLVKFLVGLTVVALVGFLCFLQFGPTETGRRAHRPIADGYDHVTVPGQPDQYLATDSRQLTIIKQVVLISVRNADGSVINGTGFMVDRGLLVTSTHLFALSNTDEMQVVCFGQRWPARIAFRRSGNDVVVAKAPDCGGEKVTFATDEPEPSERLTVVSMNVDVSTQRARRFGHDMTVLPKLPLVLSTDRTLTRHELMVKAIADAGTAYILMDGLLRPGNSGSPVLRPSGDIVGIASFVDKANKHSYAISAVEIVMAIAQVSAQ